MHKPNSLEPAFTRFTTPRRSRSRRRVRDGVLIVPQDLSGPAVPTVAGAAPAPEWREKTGIIALQAALGRPLFLEFELKHSTPASLGRASSLRQPRLGVRASRIKNGLVEPYSPTYHSGLS